MRLKWVGVLVVEMRSRLMLPADCLWKGKRNKSVSGFIWTAENDFQMRRMCEAEAERIRQKYSDRIPVSFSPLVTASLWRWSGLSDDGSNQVVFSSTSNSVLTTHRGTGHLREGREKRYRYHR